jgi:hypothetical protein
LVQGDQDVIEIKVCFNNECISLFTIGKSHRCTVAKNYGIATAVLKNTATRLRSFYMGDGYFSHDKLNNKLLAVK